MVYIPRPVSDECSVEHHFVGKSCKVVVRDAIYSVQISAEVLLPWYDALTTVLNDVLVLWDERIGVQSIPCAVGTVNGYQSLIPAEDVQIIVLCNLAKMTIFNTEDWLRKLLW